MWCVFKFEDFVCFVFCMVFDMVEQILGFFVCEGGGECGFGQVDINVLINGCCILGKLNGLVEVLCCIFVGDVVQFEIVDGVSFDFVGFLGQVFNVIMSID